MDNNLDKIRLFAETHAIEAANFIVNLSLSIDHADIHRFDDKTAELRELFPAINSPDVFQIAIGTPPPSQPKPPRPVPRRDLFYYANDGRPIWKGVFADNQILVSCMRYTNWEEIWPQAQKRIAALLSCVDEYKPVFSVDYSVVDTFSADESENLLLPPKLFKHNDYVAKHILDWPDPRWDFSQGWFEESDTDDQILIRIECRGIVRGKTVVASINNLHSQRFGDEITAGKLLHAGDDEECKSDKIFDHFHDKNKSLLRSLLADELLARMRLSEDSADA